MTRRAAIVAAAAGRARAEAAAARLAAAAREAGLRAVRDGGEVTIAGRGLRDLLRWPAGLLR